MPLEFFKKNDRVATPRDFYEELNREWNFDFDPCPLDRPEWDGLEVEWGQRNWVNPPFSELRRWIEKGLAERDKGRSSLFLIPVRGATNYWDELVFPNATQFHWVERMCFGEYKTKFALSLGLVGFEPGKRPIFERGTKGGKKSWSFIFKEDTSSPENPPAEVS